MVVDDERMCVLYPLVVMRMTMRFFALLAVVVVCMVFVVRVCVLVRDGLVKMGERRTTVGRP